MEQSFTTRDQSLQLLKSKLRASGRRRAKVNHTPATQEVTSNQQEEATEVQVARKSVHDNGKHELVKRSSKMSVLEDANLPAAGTSTTSNQDEISVTELKQQFSELKRKSTLPIIHPPNTLVPLSGDTPAPFPLKLKSYTKMVIQWSCDTCQRECIPVREESRCLCGHRYKEHPSNTEDARVKSAATFRAFACTSTKCSCKAFFYVVAEGAWILRCRCKHRHTDHDPGSKPFVCKKAKCDCRGFDSPWVCNCDHPWSAHRQHRVEKKFDPLQLLQVQCTAPELNTVHRTDLLASPLDLRL